MSGDDVVGLVFGHFWLVLVVVTVVNGQTWRRQTQARIHEAPGLAAGYRRLHRGYLFWANVPWLLMGAAVLSGQVRGVHEFLPPRAGNPAVLAWWAAVALLWLPVLFPVLFVAGWIGIGYLLAGIGGWHALARHYATADAGDGTRFRFRSARVGPVNYGSCLNFVTSLRGLHISALPLFRAGHRPLFVPWADVTARPTRQWLVAAVELRFARVPAVPVRVSRRLGEALIRESGGRVTLPAAT